ncbi:Rha family transcriptional regulator [Salipiger thiooxidans]|uniref:Rha family transcriptional regulator n=1 Tax=Salipiger thiooxidans TaxID=282683 RepID=UPI001CD65062|nr:Rha family transcriptional regulator [Salipiger thiooxidans]MCA0851225.1 Rha family transcriptional regulator [Salipiger thiooxidans]
MTIHEQSFDRDASAPRVFVRHGEVFATSRDVAACFEKRHYHVLRDIDRLVARQPTLLKPTAESDTLGGCFEEITIEVKVGCGATRLDRAYAMTRDGFALLAVGFTGEKALEFKMQYIRTFGLMERKVISHDLARNRSLHRSVEDARDVSGAFWLGLVDEARRTFGRAEATRAWAKSPLMKVDIDPGALQSNSVLLIMAFVVAQCTVTGRKSDFATTAKLLAAARAFADETGSTWPGEAEAARCFEIFSDLYTDTETGSRFWSSGQPEVGYFGIVIG